eukprot:gb/GEZN01025213.1/.p1 GENE.gb/GEZN01025213.1/~~gb/GEZN01025213.1/.p1  ORF type:complete len:166 (+),score=27.58 gb/GEZN01025213.1/:49-546(+)
MQEDVQALIHASPHPHEADFKRRHAELNAVPPPIPKGKVVFGGVSAGERNWWKSSGMMRGIRPSVAKLAHDNGYQVSSEQIEWLEQQQIMRPNQLVDYFSFDSGTVLAKEQGFGVTFFNKMRAEAMRLAEPNKVEDGKDVDTSGASGNNDEVVDTFPRGWFTKSY